MKKKKSDAMAFGDAIGLNANVGFYFPSWVLSEVLFKCDVPGSVIEKGFY